MGIITQFTSPQDVRWLGRLRIHHTLFLVKNIILLLFIILVIVEYSLFKNWWENGANTHYKSWEWAPYHFWPRIGMALVPDVVLTFISIFLILNPLHHSTYSFHPVFALVSSFVLMALYVQVCWLCPLIALSNEVGFDGQNSWENLALAETGFEAVICLLWMAMMVYSCMAVHKWRMAKKGGAVKMGAVTRGERNLEEQSV